MKQRFFFEIAYNGKKFAGWQLQPDQLTVQGAIESVFSKIYNEEIKIVGCGRTDTGVHANQYYFHVDLSPLYENDVLIYKLNRMIGDSVLFKRMVEVDAEAHSRFDARERSYTYFLSLQKDPFSNKLHLSDQRKFNLNALNDAAAVLLEYEDFFPFCKTNTDVKHYKCQLKESKWIQIDEHNFEFHITGNRFLRGMVRLIVGMCIHHMNGLISLEEIHTALKNQTRLAKNKSVAAHALFLSKISYPYSL